MRRFGWQTPVDVLKPRILLLPALLLLASVLITAPARVVAVLLPETAQLSGFTGTLWDGSAARGTLRVAGQVLSLGRVSWRIHPWSVLGLRPRVELTSEWGGQRLRAVLRYTGPRSLGIEALRAQFDVRFIRQVVPLYVGGLIRLDFSDLDFQDGTFQSGGGEMVWQDAVWTANTGDVALGDYSLVVEAVGGELSGRVETLRGPLQVAGELQLSGNRYSVNLALSGPATANQGLGDALKLLAQPSATGFDMVMSGEI